MMQRQQMARNDAINVSEKSQWKLFHEQYIYNKNLALVLTTKEIRKNVIAYGKVTVFMDATNGLPNYGFPLYSVPLREAHGHGVPAA